MQTFGGNREEVGEVNGLVVAWNGQADQDAACSTAFGYLASIEAAVRADPTLGLTAFDYVVAELSAGDVTESQNDAGATTACLSPSPTRSASNTRRPTVAALTAFTPLVTGTVNAGAAVAASDTIDQATLGSNGVFLEIINGNASSGHGDDQDFGTTRRATR
jgi:hypothetical protein